MQIQRKTLAQEVAERLIDGISNDEYTIGEKLPIEPELMNIYGVGRSSIREAIKILIIKGILNVQQGVGTFVVAKNAQESLESQMSRAEIQEVQEVRSLLDSKIAGKAALQRTDEDLKTIKKYLDLRAQYAQENSATECYEADINFHLAIAEACGNNLLKEIYKVATKHIMTSFEIRHHNNTNSFKISQKIHHDLYQSIANRNAGKASVIAQKIVDQVY